jgi:hypothetical protein
MWVLRVYDENGDEPVAEHELRDVDQRALIRILGFMPSAFLSTPLSHESAVRLDQGIAQLREPGRESWFGRELFLDLDADPEAVEQEHEQALGFPGYVHG